MSEIHIEFNARDPSKKGEEARVFEIDFIFELNECHAEGRRRDFRMLPQGVDDAMDEFRASVKAVEILPLIDNRFDCVVQLDAITGIVCQGPQHGLSLHRPPDAIEGEKGPTSP
jgi:hypothetical protein